jgi:hypothetical protein
MILFLAMILSLNAQAEGTAFTGKKATELYQAINNTGHGRCGATCIDISELSCNWSNSSDSKRISCRFKDANGKEHEVDSAKARRLANAVQAVRAIDTDCGAGTCGFRDSQDIKCSEQINRTKNFKARCSLSTHSDSCLTADKKAELESLKTKFSVTQEANPGCETMRGAGGCLPPRDMIAMQKLEAAEKNGCRAARKFNRDDKPTMEAN